LSDTVLTDTALNPGPLAGSRTLVAGRPPRPRSRWTPLRWSWDLRISAALLALIVLTALIGPFLVADPDAMNVANRLRGLGTGGHLLGTDALGRDMLARMVDGTRITLIAGLLPVAIATAIGTAIGVTAGLARRRTHSTIMRVLDVFYAFPAVLLAIAIAAALGSGITNVIAALTVAFVPPIARVADTETTRLRHLDFVEAAEASGATRATIAVRQILPNVTPPLLVYCTALVGVSIVYAAGLSFLGLSVAPPSPEWGLMISDLRQFISSKPELALIPAVAILLVSVAFNVLGEGLRKLLDIRAAAS
jgi:peptide/nickel transport system permease protein